MNNVLDSIIEKTNGYKNLMWRINEFKNIRWAIETGMEKKYELGLIGSAKKQGVRFK